MNKDWLLTPEEIYLANGGDPELLKQFGRATVCDDLANIAAAQLAKAVPLIRADAFREVGAEIEKISREGGDLKTFERLVLELLEWYD